MSLLNTGETEKAVEKATDHASDDLTQHVIPALEAMLGRVLDGYTITVTISKKP